MRTIFAAFALLLTSSAAPAWAQAEKAQTAQNDARRQALNQIVDSFRQRQFGTMLTQAEALIAAYEKDYAGEKRQIFSARTQTESLMYMTQAAAARTSSIALDDGWSTAWFLKGFALIDLNRSDEAGPALERAVALAPLNAQFLAELAEWHKSRRQWDKALDLFNRADAAAAYSPDSVKAFEQGRALRGIGFVQIELGKLDEAEAMFNRALALDPNDAKAKGELDYIRDQRAKLPKS